MPRSASTSARASLLHHDDGDDGSDEGGGSTQDTWSEGATYDPANGNDDEEEEDGEDGMDKAASLTYAQTENSAADRPGALSHSTRPSSSASRHKFESLVDHVRNSEGVPKSQAMHMARQRYPDVYQSYQQHTTSNNSGSTFKRAPLDFETAVEREIAKSGGYMSPEVAGQRIGQMYGSSLPRRLSKAADAEEEFVSKAAQLQDEDEDACSALRKCRLRNPSLYRRLQRA